MNNITIGGYTIEELKKIKTAIQKDASKVIADAVDIAEQAVRQISTMYEYAEEEVDRLDMVEVTKLAKLAAANLETAKLVSGLSGVEYSLAYNEEYRDHEGVLSDILDEIFEYEYPEGVLDLMPLLEDMEKQSYLWNSSSVYC